MKKVVFIGGTSFCGSTLLDMVLANDPKGISLGEIRAVRYPFRNHHIEERINLIKKDPRWEVIINGPVSELYPNVFKMFPNQDYIVDSSKNPLWIYNNIKALKKKRIAFYNILIYKNPKEIAYSFIKRKRGNEWAKSWINYHRLYFTMIDDFDVISYKELVSDRNALKRICDTIGIKFSDEKLNFWNKKQPTFFGNNRTRYHTFLKKEELHSFTKNNSDIFDSSEYRKIYYKEVTDLKVIQAVERIERERPEIKHILEHLIGRNNKFEIKVKAPEIFLRKFKIVVSNLLYRFKEKFHS